MPTLERAIAIAAACHAGQLDKGGHPYILHPLRLMLRLEDPTERIVAVLHDVVEDGDEDSFSQLHRDGFTSEVCDAVRALTRASGETYEDYISRAGANPIARRVKLEYLHDNLDCYSLYTDRSGLPAARCIQKFVHQGYGYI